MSSAWESLLLWSVLWKSVVWSALLSGSLALLLNTCASADLHVGMTVVGAGVFGCLLLLFWKRCRRASRSWTSFCFLVGLGWVEIGLVGAAVVAVVALALEKNSILKPRMWWCCRWGRW